MGAGTSGRASGEYCRTYAPLFGYSAKMRALRATLEGIAPTDATVLIRGESGVGKCLVARAIHAASVRAKGPFVKVNCAALPGELLESELFGHEKGAFTGAYRRKPGKFEFANTGTIFLDEIAELPPPLQAKLLHVLQDREFSRVGGREVIRVDTRVIASTNRNLELALSTGQFREDLYYRLNIVEIGVPPLRERDEEIPALASLFLERFNSEYSRTLKLSRETLELFQGYPWPGNVRELENIVRRLVVLNNPEQVHEELLTRMRVLREQPGTSSLGGADPPEFRSNGEGTLGLKEIARRAAVEAERRALAHVLERVRWNRVEAARILQVSYKTLLSKIDECGLAPERRRPTSRPSHG